MRVLSGSSDFLTESEVAKRLRISRSALFTLRKTGRLRYVTIGRTIRYSRYDLGRFIEENSRNGIAQ